MSKLVKASTEVAAASAFAAAVKVAVDGAALARPALERCPACGNTNMRDAQAQFVGACSPTCAKALGVSDEVLHASGRVPSLAACGAKSPGIITRGERAICMRLVDHEGSHVGTIKGGGEVTWADDALTQCKKCWGVGSVSVPGELVDAVCNACGGTGNEERIGPDGRRT